MQLAHSKYTDMPRAFRHPLVLLMAAALLAGCAATPEPPPAPQAPHAPPAPAPMTPAPTESAPATQRVRKTARYVVQPGDTLWGIAQRFLIDPYKWPEVWVANRDVANPHLIYPGDELQLSWVEGRTAPARIERLSPRIRTQPLDDAIPTIPLDAIRDFLRGPYIVDKDDLDQAPDVVAFDDEHLIAPDRTGAYVRGMGESARLRWLVVRPGQAYVDPDNGRTLGYEAIPAANAEVVRNARDVTLLELSDARRETRIGDRLIPLPTDILSANFYPRAPEAAVDGRIIAVFGGVTQIGQYNIVVLNRGREHGLESGHVLDAYRAARSIKDPQRAFGKLQLPPEYSGKLLVFRVEDKLSQALVMDAVRPMFVLDEVHEPDWQP